MTQNDRPTALTQRLVLLVTILGSSMAFLDGTVVNLALPTLQKVFVVDVSSVQWVVESYALTLASLLLVSGSMGDRYGRRKIYVYGVVLFTIASVMCGLANSIEWLIIARAVQGIGAALLVPGSLALITAIFPEDTRGKAIGTWSGFSALTAALGPVVGGWLIEHFSWRWVFFLNVPLALAVIVLSIKVPETKDDDVTGSLDWLGAALTTVGLGGITYALIEWPSGAHRNLLAGMAIASVIALVAFARTERHASSPMLPFALFQSRNFTGANLLTFFVYAPLGALFFFTPLDLIQIQHYSATEAGAALVPFVMSMFLFSRWAGALVGRYGARLPLTVGPLITSVGLALFALAPQNGHYWTGFLPAVLVLSLGMTITVAPLTTTLMNAVPTSEAGVASGINNAVSRLASLIAVAAFGALMVTVFNNSLDHHLAALHLPPDVSAEIQANRLQLAAIKVANTPAMQAIAASFVSAYRSVMWVAAVSVFAGALIAWFVVVPKESQRES